MSQLVTISKEVINNEEVNSVSARDLYLGLGLAKAAWSKWYEKNIISNDYFYENKDWVPFNITLNGNETRDFAVSLDFAKHISMMARTKKSHDYRNYFIECENKLKNEIQPMSQIEALLQSVQLMVDIEHRQKETESNVTELQEKVKELEYKTYTSPNEFYTVVGYASLRGIKVDVSIAGGLGKRAVRLSKEWDYPINKAHSEIFGTVNVYHVDVLTTVFESI